MANNDITFVKKQGGLGRPLAGEDHISGLLFYSDATLPTGFVLFGSTPLRLTSSPSFFWDNTLKRLGIGTTSPYAPLSVVGQIVGEFFTATSTTATSTFAGNVSLPSTKAGGENTFDSTNRLLLNSYQRAEDPGNYGEVLRAYSRSDRSKQMFAWYKAFASSTVTFTDVGDVWNATGHTLEDTERVVLTTTGTLPTGYSVGTVDDYGATTGSVYYVINATADTFQLSETKGGSAVVGTGTGSGTIRFVGVPQLKAWIGWHHKPNDTSDPLDPHDHISIETIDALLDLRTMVQGFYRPRLRMLSV